MVESMQRTLTRIRPLRVRFSLSGGCGVPNESLSLNCATIKIEYKQQKKEGSEGGNNAAPHRSEDKQGFMIWAVCWLPESA